MAETTNIAAQRAQNESERSAREIRQDIEAKRESISQTVDKLGERIHQTLDWREYVSQRPFIALGVAAGVGFLLSGIFKRRPTPQERIMDAFAEVTEDIADRITDFAGETFKRRLVSGRTVKAALTGVVTKAAMDYARNQLSGMVTGTNKQAQVEHRGQTGSNSAPIH
ncbi:MAG TPA: DUF3618 domain-containing protein [Blastocatellia bacterium]|nr:DUF3618 domain-containing protein [Blastocatellia bacterium]